MIRLLKLVIFIVIALPALGQTTFVSQPTGGAWNLGTTWNQTVCAGGCIAGVDFPGPNDVAIVDVNALNSVSFPRALTPNNFFCKDLFVVRSDAGALRASGLSGTANLTINGQISGALEDLSDVAVTTADVFHSSMSNVNIIFTGTNLDDPLAGSVITAWGNLSPFYRITTNPGALGTVRVENHSLRNSLTVQTGTLQLNTGNIIRDASTTAQIAINSGATFSVQGGINQDGTTTTRLATVTVNGTLTTGSAGYVNASTFTVGSTGIVNVGFNGVNQSRGWWFGSADPSTITLDAASTVNYTAAAAQNIYGATTYGNLSLSSSSAVTKTMFGSGILIQGNLSVGANVTFSPSTEVTFTGTAAQSISGTGTLNFNGGIEVNKSSNTVTLSKATSITGIQVTSGTLSLGDVVTTIPNSGSPSIVISPGATLTSGSSGTLTVNGNTTASGAGSLSLNNLTIGNGIVFNVDNTSITCTGSITNSGTIDFSSLSTVTFTGGSNRTISGNSITFGNIVMNKTLSTLSNNGTIEVLGNITMTNGTLDADGSGSGVLTLNSDANGDASIGVMTGGSISGELTFERYFNNTNNRWRNIGFPVSSVTFSELGNSFQLNGNSLGIYTESTLGNIDQGWTTVGSGTLNSRRGHSAYMYNVAPITVSVRGPLLQNVPATGGSPYDFQVTYTNDPGQPASEDGWNFVSNPFAAPINWNAVSGWTKTNVNAVAAVWDTQNAVYRYSNVGWDGVLAQGQSFWVQTNAASPALTATESVKVTNSDPTFYRTRDEQHVDRLMITLRDEKHSDQALLQFNGRSTLEFDPHLDAIKLRNGIFNLSSYTPQGLNLAANILPRAVCSSEVKLNITNIEFGNYTISFDGISSFADMDSVKLIDAFTNTSTLINEGDSFNFAVTADEKSFGSERFRIAFYFNSGEVLPVLSQDSRLLVTNNAAGNQWYFNDKPIPGAVGKTLHANQSGVYKVNVTDSQCSAWSKAISIELENMARVFPNPASQFLKVDVVGLLENSPKSKGVVEVFSISGERILKEKFAKEDGVLQFDISDIQPGVYNVILRIDNSSILIQERIIIE